MAFSQKLFRGTGCLDPITFQIKHQRRWFCQTAAIYYLGLFPVHSIDNPRSFVVVPAKSRFHSKAPFLYTTRRCFAASRQQQDPKAVFSALQYLVNHLEDWEPNLQLPSSSPQADSSAVQETLSSTASSFPISSSNETTKALSIEEYARIFCTGYLDLPPLKLGWFSTTAFQKEDIQNWECSRSTVLYFLAQDCGLLPSPALSNFLEDLKTQTNTTALRELQERLRKAWTPKFEQVFQCLLEQSSGQAVPLLVQLRGDVLRLMTILPKEQPELKSSLQQLEGHLRRLLSTWFSPGMLDIRRVTYNTTSAGIIEKIATKEAVHPMKSLDDLRRRLGSKRRVFSLFHPLLQDEPLVILHVHLETQPQRGIPAAMTHVLTEDDTNTCENAQPLVATFYSISNTQHGLTRGLGLGEFLIKQAVKQLQQEFGPLLETFVTLSPMPGFRKWLEIIVNNPDWKELGISSDEEAWARPLLHELLASTDNNLDEQQLEKVKDTLMKLAAHYLVVAKNPRSGKPLDPVTGFHVHNGAQVYRINFAADLSRKGLLRSLGVMVNYRYQLHQIETNKAMLETSHWAEMPVSAGVQDLLAK